MAENESPEELRRRAFMVAKKLKNSGLDAETIYARLEKEGIPVQLAREVAINVWKDQKKAFDKEKKETQNKVFAVIGIGFLLIILSLIVAPGKIIIPIVIIIGAVLYAIDADI